MMRNTLAVALALFAVNSFADNNAYSPAGCADAGGTVVPVNGVVTSTPVDPDPLYGTPDYPPGCYEAETLAPEGEPVNPVADPLLAPDPKCLRIEASGTIKMSGYSQLTMVPVSDPLGATATTPVCFTDLFGGVFADETRGCGLVDLDLDGLPDPLPLGSAGLVGFTSQVAMTGGLLGHKYQGTIYTKDTGFITADYYVGQVLLIVGGTVDLKYATGRIAVAGQEVGGEAMYTGHVCVMPPAE